VQKIATCPLPFDELGEVVGKRMAVKGGSLPKQLPHQYSSPFVCVEMNGRLARLCAQTDSRGEASVAYRG